MSQPTKFLLIGLTLVVVIVGFVWRIQKSIVQPQRSNRPSFVETESSTPPSRIFHSQTNDFQIEYPQNYSVENDGVFVYKELKFSIINEPNQDNIPITRWVNEHPNYVEESERDVDSATGFTVAGANKLAPITVAGQDGLEQRYGAEGGYLQWRVFLPYNNQIYIITFNGYPSDGVDRAELDYKYFLSHFKLK